MSVVGWLLLESLLAFVVLVLIVAWTTAPLRKRRRVEQRKRDPSGLPHEDQ